MALNSEQILTNLVPVPADQEVTTARGQVLTTTSKKISEAKRTQLINAREEKKRKREEEKLKQQALHEEIQKTRAELTSVKGMLENQAEKMDESSSSEEESDSSSSEEDEPAPKRRKIIVEPIPRSTPQVEYDVVPAAAPRSFWGKLGGLVLIAAANAVVATLHNLGKPTTPNGQRQPAINAYSTLYG